MHFAVARAFADVFRTHARRMRCGARGSTASRPLGGSLEIVVLDRKSVV